MIENNFTISLIKIRCLSRAWFQGQQTNAQMELLMRKTKIKCAAVKERKIVAGTNVEQKNPPEICLQGLDSFWMKDPRKNVWVAQERTENLDLQTTNASLTNTSYPTDSNEIDNTTSKCTFEMKDVMCL